MRDGYLLCKNKPEPKHLAASSGCQQALSDQSDSCEIKRNLFDSRRNETDRKLFYQIKFKKTGKIKQLYIMLKVIAPIRYKIDQLWFS